MRSSSSAFSNYEMRFSSFFLTDAVTKPVELTLVHIDLRLKVISVLMLAHSIKLHVCRVIAVHFRNKTTAFLCYA